MDTNDSFFAPILEDDGMINIKKISQPTSRSFASLPVPKNPSTEKGSIVPNEYSEDETLAKIRTNMAKLDEDLPLMQPEDLFAARVYGYDGGEGDDIPEFLKKNLMPGGGLMKHIKAKKHIKGYTSTSIEDFITGCNSSSQYSKARGEPASSANQDPSTESAKPVPAESSKAKATHNVSSCVNSQVYACLANFDFTALLTSFPRIAPQNLSSQQAKLHFPPLPELLKFHETAFSARYAWISQNNSHNILDLRLHRS
jgi:hypothetical protein